MKSYTQKLRTYYRFFYWILIFSISVLLLHLILPGEQLFKFEYQKGSSWKHDNLIAPFDFAIAKTAAEIEAEKQELTKNLAPFYKLDSQIFVTQSNIFKNDFYLISDSTDVATNQIFNRLNDALKFVYSSGILLSSPDSYETLNGKTEISRITGKIVSKVPIENIFSERTAYNYVVDVKNRLQQEYPQFNRNFFSFDIGRYIKSNMEFDAATTQKQIEETESGISTTRGIVEAGERIILKGELVDAQKYNILESLKKAYENKRGEGVNKYMITGGKLLLIVLIMTIFFIFLYHYRRDILDQLRRLTFLLLMVVSMVFISIFANSYDNLNIYLVPLAILRLSSVLFSIRERLFLHL